MQVSTRTLSYVVLIFTLTISSAGCTESQQPGFIEWATKNAVAIGSLETPLGDASRVALRRSIGEADVVGIGESRHDTREQLLLKILIVRELIQSQGFRVLALEESQPHVAPLDRYVVAGDGELREITNQLAGWYLWDTEEMLTFFEWIREFNESRSSEDQVRLYGTDISAPAPGIEEVLGRLGPAAEQAGLDRTTLGLDLQRGDFWPGTWERYHDLTDERREELATKYDQLIALVESEHDRLASGSSEEDYDWLHQLARSGRYGNGLFSSGGLSDGGVVREAGMAENLLWILDRENSRVVLWAHNLHVAKSPFRMPGLADGTFEPMGMHLDAALGERYISMGATFAGGSYPADLPPGERTFETPDPETIDGAFNRVGPAHFWIDLRAIPDGTTAANWIDQERGHRAQDADATLSARQAFDLIFFVQQVTRAQPTEAALQRLRSQSE